ncbi:Polygalacturonase, partial [Bienertia sinuspersici]
MKSLIILLLIIILLGLNLAATEHHYYDVVSLGARPNSKFDSSNALQMAWQSACGSLGRSTIIIPQGQFLIQTHLEFSGKGCKSNDINFVINGTIVAPKNFHVFKDSAIWLLFHNVDGIKIHGGVFDGHGSGLWACKRSGHGNCPRGVETLTFRNSRNVEINGITSLNSQLYHIVIDGCHNVK